LDGVSHHLLVVELRLGGDFTEDHNHTGLGGGLTSDLGKGILAQAGIKNGVGDLVCNLVRVTLAYGLGLRKSLLAAGIELRPRSSTGKTAIRQSSADCRLEYEVIDTNSEEESALVVVLP